MTSSLFAALSGLRVHQQWIDVIGNNLANASTPGFKSARATFADAFSQTLRFAAPPDGERGGLNPMQIGLGVEMGSVDRLFAQGALTTTGRIFDLALEGGGFFGLTDGAQRYFSRVGTFGLDSQENLVDQRTGYQVIDPFGNPVTLDVDSLFPPSATTAMTMTGNLPAVVTGPLAEVLTGSTGLQEGFAAQLVATAAGPTFAVTNPGDTYSLELVVNGAAPQQVNVTDSDTDGFLTEAEIVAALDAADDVSAVVNGSGFIEVTSDRTGAAVTMKINAGSPGEDLAALIGISTSAVSGSEQMVGPTTDLNTLPANVTSYVSGDTIDITGVDTDGTAINASFTYGAANDGTTVNDFMAFIDNLYTDANVSLNSSGQIVVEAQTPGEANLLLAIADGSGAMGSTEWPTYAVSVTTDGTGPDEVATSTEVFDSRGVAHTVTLTFQRQADGTWNAAVTIPQGEGTVLVGGPNDPIQGITFNADGSPNGLGSVDSSISIQFTGQAGAQQMQVDLGTDGEFEGLTQFGGQTSAYVSFQDGYGDGELANISVAPDGSVDGFYTNGQTRNLGAIGIATFTNDEGLMEVGSNLWAETTNSGTALLGTGSTPGAGNVVAGALENSNVDTAEQFVRLIEAQRGFQANARVITTQDEVLAEVVNLI